MHSREDVRSMVRSDGHQGLIAGGCSHFLGPAQVTLSGDDAVAVCESILVRHRDGGYSLRRAGANHFVLHRGPDGWRIRTARHARSTAVPRHAGCWRLAHSGGRRERAAGWAGRAGHRWWRGDRRGHRTAGTPTRGHGSLSPSWTRRAVGRWRSPSAGCSCAATSRSAADVEAAVAAAVAAYGSIDVLVNNAWGGGSI